MTASIVDCIDVGALVMLTRDLVRFNTTNPPGNEEEAVRYLAGYLSAAGAATEVQVVEPGRANLIARLRGRERRGHLVLSGHMDVVPPGETPWIHDPFAGEQVGDRLYGRGAADMKGGVAAMAVAMATLARAGLQPRADLILAISAGEEGEGIGARHMAASGVLAGSAALVVGEFSGLDVYIGHKGGCIMRITARGRAAHSATPHLGVNAVEYIAHVITALQHRPFSFTRHDLLGEPTVSVTIIEGGVKRNVIPDRCSITVGVRTVPGQSPDVIAAEMQQILDDVATSTGLAVQTEIQVRGMAPVVTPRDHLLVQTVVDAVTAVRGVTPAVEGVPYGTDAMTLVPAYGLPMVIVGPGHFAQAHQPDEYVEIAELAIAARIYARVAETWLA